MQDIVALPIAGRENVLGVVGHEAHLMIRVAPNAGAQSERRLQRQQDVFETEVQLVRVVDLELIEDVVTRQNVLLRLQVRVLDARVVEGDRNRRGRPHRESGTDDVWDVEVGRSASIRRQGRVDAVALEGQRAVGEDGIDIELRALTIDGARAPLSVPSSSIEAPRSAPSPRRRRSWFC